MDSKTVDELHAIYSDSAEAMYASMLKNGCEAYESGYFEKNFTRLQALDYQSITKGAFLQELKADCDEIGEENNLGEFKSYVLLQTISTKLGEQIANGCLHQKYNNRVQIEETEERQ